jgi:hypothetical protein
MNFEFIFFIIIILWITGDGLEFNTSYIVSLSVFQGKYHRENTYDLYKETCELFWDSPS